MAKELEGEKEIGKGLDAFFMHRDKCKAKGVKPASLQRFFEKYNPETLEPTTKRYGSLGKYVQRYQREMRKRK